MADAPGAPPVPPRFLRELAIGLAVFGVYLLVDLMASPARYARADTVGAWVLRVERSAHLDVEGWLNRHLEPHYVLSVVANYEYAFTYILSALLLLGWLYVRHPEEYVRARQSFVVLNLAAITCFAVLPVTPPRLLPGTGFFDTVTSVGTAGSWGTPLVDLANQRAAIPSLHVAWALWVSVVLARLARGMTVQLLSGVHVVVTVLVVLATANHYLVDAVVAVPFVWWSIWAVEWWSRASPGRAVPCADVFFLHVESPEAAQHVGGLVVLEPTGGPGPTAAEVRALVRSELPQLPRFTRRLHSPSRWRRLRWVPVPGLDWDWHVTERQLESTDGLIDLDELDQVVAELASTPLPRDRPLWRIVLVHARAQSAMLFLVHHSLADGLGTVVQALRLFRPETELPRPSGRAPGPLRRAAASTIGIAQLATDGRPSARLKDPPSQSRGFATVGLDLADVRRVARKHRVRVTDLILALTAEGVARTSPGLVAATEAELRTSVSMLVPTTRAADGNVTAAVMVDLPLAAMTVQDRLREITARAAPLRSPTRALASRLVVGSAIGLLPEPVTAWFARTVYGRRFFHAVVSNMPGPTQQLSLCDVPLGRVSPILPLAPQAPIALGALSWNGVLGVGLAVDPRLLEARAVLGEAMCVLEALVAQCGELETSARNIRPLDSGSSRALP